MGTASSAELDVLRTELHKNFQQGYDLFPQWHGPLMTEVKSSTASNTYGWMKQIPKLREWVGPRVINQLAESDYAIKNKKYELTLAIPEDDFEDDNLGQYSMHAQLLGESAGEWFDDILLSLMENGAAENGFDEVPFFSALHPLNPDANQSNLFTGTALTADNLFTVRKNMSKYKGEAGRKLGVMPNLLIVPTALKKAALEAVTAQLTGGGNSNVAQNLMQVIEVPKLESDDFWYVADGRRAIKPFIKQLRRNLRKVSYTSERDGNVFWDGEYVWGYDGRGNGGYGPWWLCSRCAA